MYHYICHTCEEDEVFRELADAQASFNDHADDGHNVEIVRVDSSRQRGYSADEPDSDDGGRPADASETGPVRADMPGSGSSPTAPNADPD